MNVKQDFDVMEALVEKYIKEYNRVYDQNDGTLSDIFMDHLPINNIYFVNGWQDIDDVENDPDDKDGDKNMQGARLLLLLAYMMVSNVNKDGSTPTQV